MQSDDFLRGVARGFVTLLKEQGFASYIFFMSNFDLTRGDMDRVHVHMNAMAGEYETIPAVIIQFPAKAPESEQRVAFYIVAINNHELWVNWQQLLMARRMAKDKDPNYTEFEQEFTEYNVALKAKLIQSGYNAVDFSDIPATVQ